MDEGTKDGGSDMVAWVALAVAVAHIVWQMWQHHAPSRARIMLGSMVQRRAGGWTEGFVVAWVTNIGQRPAMIGELEWHMEDGSVEHPRTLGTAAETSSGQMLDRGEHLRRKFEVSDIQTLHQRGIQSVAFTDQWLRTHKLKGRTLRKYLADGLAQAEAANASTQSQDGAG
ncbi:MAG: hypothetical protein AAF196_09040 [Planctomycetota bacterium]